jgi:hypothetical protein
VGKRGLEPEEGSPVDEEGHGSSGAPSENPVTSPAADDAAQGSRPLDRGVTVANVASALADALKAVLTGDVVNARQHVTDALAVLEQLGAP